MQVDWGECGRVPVGSTTRKVSVFVAVLCYSRLQFIEFTLSQRQAEFYRGLVNALTFFGGSPRQLIFDNLKAAVINDIDLELADPALYDRFCHDTEDDTAEESHGTT